MATAFSFLLSLFKAIPIVDKWFVQIAEMYFEKRVAESQANRQLGAQQLNRAKTDAEILEGLRNIRRGSGR